MLSAGQDYRPGLGGGAAHRYHARDPARIWSTAIIIGAEATRGDARCGRRSAAPDTGAPSPGASLIIVGCVRGVGGSPTWAKSPMTRPTNKIIVIMMIRAPRTSPGSSPSCMLMCCSRVVIVTPPSPVCHRVPPLLLGYRVWTRFPPSPARFLSSGSTASLGAYASPPAPPTPLEKRHVTRCPLGRRRLTPLGPPPPPTPTPSQAKLHPRGHCCKTYANHTARGG